MESIYKYKYFQTLLDTHGVTAYRVAKETKITTATLTNWKKGKYTPKANKLQKIADYFGVPLSYLLTGEIEEKTIEPQIKTKAERDLYIILTRITDEISNQKDEPLLLKGEELNDVALEVLKNTLKFAITQAEAVNKLGHISNKK